MKLGDYVKAESNGGWKRFSGIFLKETETEVVIDDSGEIRYLRKDLFNFRLTDAWGREIK